MMEARAVSLPPISSSSASISFQAAAMRRHDSTDSGRRAEGGGGGGERTSEAARASAECILMHDGNLVDEERQPAGHGNVKCVAACLMLVCSQLKLAVAAPPHLDHISGGIGDDVGDHDISGDYVGGSDSGALDDIKPDTTALLLVQQKQEQRRQQQQNLSIGEGDASPARLVNLTSIEAPIDLVDDNSNDEDNEEMQHALACSFTYQPGAAASWLPSSSLSSSLSSSFVSQNMASARALSLPPTSPSSPLPFQAVTTRPSSGDENDGNEGFS
eukprot:CAMPEP_0171832754 /NCGR_PEP_ID=MMETSP0992-20121227/9523_1 /TAXON_ID=483369 /ORGANISM="non described non described, Strain CCMP2098" /LENGTH=272 /DNA_ID=CAMNT_0012448341 /DNA_START=84 /DNA_END=902 /DNA_ORIENTATION=-